MDSESPFLVTGQQDGASPSPPSSATAAAEDDYEANSDINILKMQMMLSWADREKNDLEIVIQALKTENSALKAQFRDSKMDEHTAAQGLQEENTALKALIRELEDNEAGETLKLQMENLSLKANIQRSQAGETAAVERLQEQNDRLKASFLDLQKRNEELLIEQASLKEGLRKAESRSEFASDTLKMAHELQERVEKFRGKNSELTEKNYRLEHKHLENLKAAQESQKAIDLLVAENEQKEQEVQDMRSKLKTARTIHAQIGPNKQALSDLQEKLDAAEKDRNRHKSDHEKLLQTWTKFMTEHQQLLHGKTALTAQQAASSTQISSLKNEVSTMRNNENHINQQNARLKTSIAHAITCLDLIYHGHRVFTCKHNPLDRLPDGKKSTFEFRAKDVAHTLFNEWSPEKEFDMEYQRQRQSILDHHLAHERADPGRGAWAASMKSSFISLDSGRNIKCNYS
ncbi:hypothetical protein IQ07DRAFT_641390 [Pyrenochaeta sp. DS3sAY3a]|nr:hypothetical protein IQ07DRAFT_641390 [Pyrenochaeta sp. DS3sAY3a]